MVNEQQTMNLTVEIPEIFTESTESLRLTTAAFGVLIYVAGFIGNFLSLILFLQKELRQVSTGLIFLLLNIFCTIHLLSLVIEFFDSIFQVRILLNDVFRCQFLLWSQNATRTMCSFLATTVSIDRFLRSEYPMRSRVWCTTKNVLKLFYIYLLFSALLYAFFFHPRNVFDNSGQCSFPFDDVFRLIALNIMPPLRFILICVLPITLMTGCGARMLMNIQRTKRRIAQQRAPHIVVAIANTVLSQMSSNTMDDHRRQTAVIDHMLLLMVLANVVAYTVTQLPFNIYTLYYGFGTSADFQLYSLMRVLLLIWSSIYFGIGFYLFCLTSSPFRKRFITKIQQLRHCDRQPRAVGR